VMCTGAVAAVGLSFTASGVRDDGRVHAVTRRIARVLFRILPVALAPGGAAGRPFVVRVAGGACCRRRTGIRSGHGAGHMDDSGTMTVHGSAMATGRRCGALAVPGRGAHAR